MNQSIKHGRNDYESLAETYQQTDEKPDKKYSILPTILNIVGNIQNKTVLDLACGSGFFTRALAKKGPKKVIGFDNAQAQIQRAVQLKVNNITYELRDLFTDSFPQVDNIVAPFVLNFPEKRDQLKMLLLKIYKSLKEGGQFTSVMDFPNGKDLKKYGSKKTLLGKESDETPIKIELFDREIAICILQCTYFTKETIEQLLEEVGFNDVSWHMPIITDEGIQKLGSEFWANYIEETDLAYLSAKKTT